MTINLYYRYSELDKRKEFFITCDKQCLFYQWAFAYVIKYLPKRVVLYPYKPHDDAKFKSYHNPKDAEIVAKNIVKRIKKELQKN